MYMQILFEETDLLEGFNYRICHQNFYSDQTNTIYFNINLEINKSHLNIIMLHIAIIYLVWRGQKYATKPTVCLQT